MRRAGPLRVAVVNDALTVGGAERVAVDIANSLDRSSHRVWFCATRGGGPLRESLLPDISVNVLHRRATWDLVGATQLATFLRTNQIDLVHSHGRGTMKLVSLLRTTHAVNVRHVFHDHFGWLHQDRGADTGLRVALSRGVDAYLGVDSRLCRWATEVVGLPANRVHLQRSGVDLARFEGMVPVDPRKEFGLDADHFVMVMIANFRPQKDHPTLFRAIALLEPEHRQRLRVVVCGSTSADAGYFDRCSAMVEELGIDRNVVVAGARSDAIALVAGADGAVLSSKNETGPLVVLEYMACGRPFVATETGEIAQTVAGMGVGLVPTPRDHHELAAAIRTMMNMSAADRDAMGRRGRAVAATEFSQACATRRVEDIYRELMLDRVG